VVGYGHCVGMPRCLSGDGEIWVSIRCSVNQTQPPDILLRVRVRDTPRVRPKLNRGDYLRLATSRSSSFSTRLVTCISVYWPISLIGLSLHFIAGQIGNPVRHSRCHLPVEDQVWNTLMIGSPRLSTRPAGCSITCCWAQNPNGNRYGAG
jgi:hypothetical protein